ncbi:hypothetical protein [Streptomyces scopuliridis]|uniref:Uncharacterized protein n=1 Tax=Streptomyces scopuliridis RB72 TaxID=1440053 RepID=A0A2T7T6K3_9ACTN|nr:hypothetical protein [Streptomyces scopuliridis]PVE10676.1 hypothetical protein Y717_26715 [Streptomyces scopuliridis RB72]
MTRIGSRRRRFMGVGVGGALLGMLVALVFCLPSAAVAVGIMGTAGTVATEAVTAGGGYGGQTPGCGRGDRDDTGTPPITPTRGSSVHELLPVLHDARDTAGAWGAAQAVLAVTPDRGPPPVAAPSPVDLSVLRV